MLKSLCAEDRNSEQPVNDGEEPGIEASAGCDHSESPRVQGLICQVVGRKDSNLYLDRDNICVALNNVATAFIPIIGDWISVQRNINVDVNRSVDDSSGKKLQVERICAREPRNLEGTITTWDQKANKGVVDQGVFFYGDALEPVYVPIVGDKVVAMVIKSDQDGCDLQALKLIPEQQKSGKLTLDGSFKAMNVGLRRDLQSNEFNNKSSELVRSQTHGTRFAHKKMLYYPVPQDLYTLVLTQEQCKGFVEILGQAQPNLPRPLTYENATDRLHTLLYLEEIYQLLSIRVYSKKCTRFHKRDDFLALKYKNLSERRPTLSIGDKIVAKSPHVYNALEYEGFVSKVDDNYVYLQFAENFPQKDRLQDVSVKFVASRKCFRRMHHAVDLAVRMLGQETLFPTEVTEVEPQVTFDYDPYSDEVMPKEPKLHAGQGSTDQIPKSSNSPFLSRLLLNDSLPDTSSTTQGPPEPEVSTCVSQPKLEWHNSNLNYFQKEAVRNILLGVARPLPYIIFGPPGTGKTVTLVESILQILRLIPHSRLLVATPSNSAADMIALRLVDSEVLQAGDLIRLVGYRCVIERRLPKKLLPYCATGEMVHGGTRSRQYTVGRNGLTHDVNSTIIARHRITVGTCSCLGTLFEMGFPKEHFTHVIVDEAAQLVDPEVMIPLSFINPKEGQIILAGDPLQLGPIIGSKGALAYGFDVTLLDRLPSVFPYIRDPQAFPKTNGFDPRFITRLVYNYRSLPQLLTLVSDMFYDSQLIATVSRIESEEACLLTKVKKILPASQVSELPAMVFHGVIGDSLQTPDCPSWFNLHEATQVKHYLNALYRQGLKASDIGIITPYSKQAQKIRDLLVDAGKAVPNIGTVEQFQGQEFNVVLLSTVRSDANPTSFDKKFLGFLSNPRRLNVAISRAKALLIIVGNPHVLCSNLHWRNVIKFCVEKGGYCGCQLPESSYNC